LLSPPLSFTSAGSGTPFSSLRSTVCEADSTFSNFKISTGDSHTTWIILPGNKKVKKNETTKTFPQNIHTGCAFEQLTVEQRTNRLPWKSPIPFL
jgi:hypothetical protein